MKCKINFGIILCCIFSLIFAGCNDKTSTDTIEPATTGSCSGTILDASTGAPIRFAEVFLTPHSSLPELTEYDGFYKIENVEAGQYTLRVEASGYKTASRTIIITAGTITSYDISLTPLTDTPNDGEDDGSITPPVSAMGDIMGFVRDIDTNSIIDVAVVTLEPLGEGFKTNNGFFKFTNVPAGNYYLVAKADGYNTSTDECSVKAGETTTVELFMRVNPNGDNGEDDGEEPNPIVPVVCDVMGVITDSSTGATVNVATHIVLEPLGEKVITQNGFYQFSNIQPGNYFMMVSAEGYNSTSLEVELQEGTNTQNITLSPVDSTPGNGNQEPEEDYSEARVSTTLSNLSVRLVSCVREGSNVVMKYMLTNTYPYGNMGMTIQNVNSFTQKTQISDDLGMQYPQNFVQISLAGKTFGWGNNIEGTLLPDIATPCIITVQNVDSKAQYMTYNIYTSTAFPGDVNTSANVILSKVKIH